MLVQSFGAETSTNDADTLTAVEFDNSGEYLATGDQGGRVVLFSRVPVSPSKGRSQGSRIKETSPGDDEWIGSVTKVRAVLLILPVVLWNNALCSYVAVSCVCIGVRVRVRVVPLDNHTVSFPTIDQSVFMEALLSVPISRASLWFLEEFAHRWEDQQDAVYETSQWRRHAVDDEW